MDERQDRIEREVKLRFASAEAARAAVHRLDAPRRRARRLQDDRLLDTPDGRLRAGGRTLRVRLDGPADDGAATAIVTVKGPPAPDVMKVREELETGVDDGAVMLRLLERTGFEVWFRYQKYREEFTGDDAVIAIDETPAGVFVEVEGSEAGVTRTARALGRGPGDYVTASYRELWAADCAARGRPVGPMVFA